MRTKITLWMKQAKTIYSELCYSKGVSHHLAETQSSQRRGKVLLWNKTYGYQWGKLGGAIH